MKEEIFKIQQVFERMMEEKLFVITDRNGSYHSYTKVYPEVVKTLFRKLHKKMGIQQMNELTEEILYKIIDEKIDNYHTNFKFSVDHLISMLNPRAWGNYYKIRKDTDTIIMDTEFLPEIAVLNKINLENQNTTILVGYDSKDLLEIKELVSVPHFSVSPQIQLHKDRENFCEYMINKY